MYGELTRGPTTAAVPSAHRGAMALMTLPSTDHVRDTSPPRLPAARTVDAVKVYGKGDTAVRALDGVTVDFAAGGFTAIMGPSGSGKSTLLHAVAGLDDLTSGHVFIGDTDLTRLRDRALTTLRRDRIGFVFQAFNLVPTLTAIENITLPMASPTAGPTSSGSAWSSRPSASATA